MCGLYSFLLTIITIVEVEVSLFFTVKLFKYKVTCFLYFNYICVCISLCLIDLYCLYIFCTEGSYGFKPTYPSSSPSKKPPLIFFCSFLNFFLFFLGLSSSEPEPEFESESESDSGSESGSESVFDMSIDFWIAS